MICKPATAGGTVRHLRLGCSGYGKSVGLVRDVDGALRGGVARLALVFDDKDPRPQFPGRPLGAPCDGHAPMRGGYPAVVYRGAWRSRGDLTAEDVALAGRALADRGVRVVLVFDELRRCLSDSGAKLTAPTVRWAYKEARTRGLSVIGSTQQPQELPRESTDQATSIALHFLESKSVNYLSERLAFDDEMLATVGKLDVGDFVLHRPGAPWDRLVYRYQLRR